MIKNLIMRMCVILTLGLLGACTSMTKLPDGTYLGIHGVANLNHASSYSARWRDTGQKDSEGNPIMEELKVDKVLGVKQDGTPIVVQQKDGEKIQGPSVAGQIAVAVVAGPGTAATNGYFGKEIAKIGKCAPGANCGNVNNISATAAADSKSQGEQNTNVKTVIGGTGAVCAAGTGTPCASGD